MTRPRLLDLFCAGGGASVGYHRAGFDVTGVDIVDQPRYPFEFHRGDALEFVKRHGHEFEVVTASPPCFLNSTLAAVLVQGHGHVELIPETRDALIATGLPYVVENVPGADLRDPLVLCGSMFHLGADCHDGRWRQLRRHRLFESNVALVAPAPCRHDAESLAVHGGGPSHRERASRAGTGSGYTYQGRMSERRQAMGVDWLPRESLNLAIPPAYTEWIGRLLVQHLYPGVDPIPTPG